jgi:hypothetical protein
MDRTRRRPRGQGPSRDPALWRRVAAAAALLLAAACTGPGRGGPGDRPTPAATAAPTAAPGPSAVAATATTTPPRPAAGEPRYLAGRPLTGPTGLRLLVAADPPRVLDVDRGTSRRVEGLPAGHDPVGVAPAGRDAIVVAGERVFLVRRGARRASPLGRGVGGVASLDGRGVWLATFGAHCGVRGVGLDGRARRGPWRLPCPSGLAADTRVGLVVWTAPTGDGDRGALLDPGSGRVLARYPEIHGVAGDRVLWSGPGRDGGPFTLTDRRTRVSHRLPRPTPYGDAGFGLPSPDGRLLAVEFADPSWSRVHGQVSDIWLLDVRARRWRRLPGMPLITALKAMDMAWTGDGRLLLVGDFERVGEALVSWRPGQDHLAVKPLDLPRSNGSDTFVPWPAA